MGGLISGLLGGGNSAGQEQQQQALKASRADIQQLRPELMQAKLNLLRNATGAYQGSNNALETLWGDPNAKPAPVGGEPQPQRMMGHELPQQPMVPQVSTPQPRQGGGFNPFDPLGIFGGR